jgi:hypothetical protein
MGAMVGAGVGARDLVGAAVSVVGSPGGGAEGVVDSYSVVGPVTSTFVGGAVGVAEVCTFGALLS